MASKASNLVGALIVATCSTSLPVWSGDSDDGWEKMVFHVDEMRNVRWALMLANSSLDANPGAQISIVTYGPGIDFLLQGTMDKRGNGFDASVESLVEQGVDLAVCGTTLDARNIGKARAPSDVIGRFSCAAITKKQATVDSIALYIQSRLLNALVKQSFRLPFGQGIRVPVL